MPNSYLCGALNLRRDLYHGTPSSRESTVMQMMNATSSVGEREGGGGEAAGASKWSRLSGPNQRARPRFDGLVVFEQKTVFQKWVRRGIYWGHNASTSRRRLDHAVSLSVGLGMFICPARLPPGRASFFCVTNFFQYKK